MTSFKYVSQLDETDCGAAALGFIKAAEHFGFLAQSLRRNKC
ncbi:hypothetical protein [Lactiplantibacillus xiangfangensis]